ncbi:MAG: hypothetical protein MHM6MM_007724, partial [Cercozoa sp. M6MM]
RANALAEMLTNLTDPSNPTDEPLPGQERWSSSAIVESDHTDFALNLVVSYHMLPVPLLRITQCKRLADLDHLTQDEMFASYAKNATVKSLWFPKDAETGAAFNQFSNGVRLYQHQVPPVLGTVGVIGRCDDDVMATWRHVHVLGAEHSAWPKTDVLFATADALALAFGESIWQLTSRIYSSYVPLPFEVNADLLKVVKVFGLGLSFENRVRPRFSLADVALSSEYPAITYINYDCSQRRPRWYTGLRLAPQPDGLYSKPVFRNVPPLLQDSAGLLSLPVLSITITGETRSVLIDADLYSPDFTAKYADGVMCHYMESHDDLQESWLIDALKPSNITDWRLRVGSISLKSHVWAPLYDTRPSPTYGYVRPSNATHGERLLIDLFRGSLDVPEMRPPLVYGQSREQLKWLVDSATVVLGAIFTDTQIDRAISLGTDSTLFDAIHLRFQGIVINRLEAKYDTALALDSVVVAPSNSTWQTEFKGDIRLLAFNGTRITTPIREACRIVLDTCDRAGSFDSTQLLPHCIYDGRSLRSIFNVDRNATPALIDYLHTKPLQCLDSANNVRRRALALTLFSTLSPEQVRFGELVVDFSDDRGIESTMWSQARTGKGPESLHGCCGTGT